MAQDWLSDDDVSSWLDKYDWDSSGDISFDEFEGLVRVKLTECPLCPPKGSFRSAMLLFFGAQLTLRPFEIDWD